MRLFWKVFAVLWLATLLVGGSGFLISRALQQDWLLLQFHPQLRDFSSQLVGVYEEQGPAAAQQWLEQQLQQYRLRAELFNDQGQRLLQGTLPTLPRREASDEASPRDRAMAACSSWPGIPIRRPTSCCCTYPAPNSSAGSARPLPC